MKGRLDLIRVCFAEDAWGMLRSLDDAGRFLKPGDVCVVDAPSRVLTPNLGGDRNPQGHQLLALATRALQTLARRGVCVLVANSTARGLSDGMDDEGISYEYDEFGNLLAQVDDEDMNEQWDVRINYSYQDCRLVEIQETELSGISNSVRYSYDLNGRLFREDYDWDDDGGTDRGAVHMLFLNADGTVKADQKMSSTTVRAAPSALAFCTRALSSSLPT